VLVEKCIPLLTAFGVFARVCGAAFFFVRCFYVEGAFEPGDQFLFQGPHLLGVMLPKAWAVEGDGVLWVVKFLFPAQYFFFDGCDGCVTFAEEVVVAVFVGAFFVDGKVRAYLLLEA
jgi:hypothetical protein